MSQIGPFFESYIVVTSYLFIVMTENVLVTNGALKQSTESDQIEAPLWRPAAFIDTKQLAADDFALLSM